MTRALRWQVFAVWTLVVATATFVAARPSSAAGNNTPQPSYKVGDVAPDFTMRDQNGKNVSLHDFRGKNVVLAFYVFAFSGGCTQEVKAYQQNLEKLASANTQVLGVSVDSTFANKAWADQIGISFPLLSDLGGDVSRKYGIYNPKSKASRRVTYVIDPQGKIAHMQVDSAAIDPSETVLACQRQKLKH